MKKTCTKCGIEKDAYEFYKDARCRDGLMSACKKCIIRASSLYHQKNKEKRAIYRKEYQSTPSGRQAARRGAKKWNQKNKKWISDYGRIYYQANKEKLATMRRVRENNLRKIDPIFKIKSNLSRRLRECLGSKGKSKRTLQYVGLTAKQLKEYIESRFQCGMSWNNYGINGWTIDHTLPVTSFDHSDEEQIKKCWHYTNLKPMWHAENLKKRDKIL